MARMAVPLAGLPHTVPGYTVNRLCASGLTAVANAAQAIRVRGGRPRRRRRCGVDDPRALGDGQARQPVGQAGRGARHLAGLALHQPAFHGHLTWACAGGRGARDGQGDPVDGETAEEVAAR